MCELSPNNEMGIHEIKLHLHLLTFTSTVLVPKQIRFSILSVYVFICYAHFGIEYLKAKFVFQRHIFPTLHQYMVTSSGYLFNTKRYNFR